MTSRRDFLSSSGSALGGAWLARLAPVLGTLQACASDAMREGRPFTTFTEREGADFDAFAARIIPTDDTPGAREAGSVYFADLALARDLAEVLPLIRGGLESLHARVLEGWTDATSFADLTEAQQDEMIAEIEQEDPNFFFVGRMLVTLGLVAEQEYGGNRAGIGWRLIGFEPLYRHEPPFGYYDRDEHGAAAAAARGDGDDPAAGGAT